MEPPKIDDLENLQEIGRSSFLVTYRAEREGSQFLVEILTEDTPESRREFHRTTALHSRLGHPGMPPVRHSGEADGRLYRVRELVEGKPVSGMLASGPLSNERLVSTGRALASALTALHRRAMTHTEIHPDGLKVDSSGLIRFVDAGRSWPVQRALPRLERSLALPYLAPEAREGAPARTESDVFSLGAILASLALGKPAPANGASQEFLQEASQNLTPALRVLLKSMLDKDPAKRPDAHTVTDCLTKIDQLDVLLRLKAWKPEPAAATFMGHHAYPLIGREQELGQLMALWQKARKGNGVSVTILGEKGSGRRRLVEELKRGVIRSGGSVVRHRLEAESDKPTLIVNFSHKGRHGNEPNQPWLSVNFAQTGPVPDQYTIELHPLPEGDCLRLAEAYLASALDQELQKELFSRGAQLPSKLLQSLDQWCESGVLRPASGRWNFTPEEETPASPGITPVVVSEGPKALEIDYAQAQKTIVELWATSLKQDDPMVSALMSFCRALKCERADLYQLVDNQAKYVCASSFGRHRLDKDLVQQILRTSEPCWSKSTLLYPLTCGATFCGFLSLQWWDAGVPEFCNELFETIAMAGAPMALTLGQTQLEDRRLKRITLALEDLSQATPEPMDIMTRLSEGMRKSLEFDILSAWITREGRLDRLFTDPKGEEQVDGSEHKDVLSVQPFEARTVDCDKDIFLALPLASGEELLGGLIISRDPSIGFSETEIGWASALVRIAETALKTARMFGDQVSV